MLAQAREKAKKAAKAEPEEEEEETIESLERAGKKIPAAKRRMLEAIAAKRAAEEAARKEAEEAQQRVRDWLIQIWSPVGALRDQPDPFFS